MQPKLTWNKDKLRSNSCTSNASSALDQICSSCLSDIAARRRHSSLVERENLKAC